MRRRVPPFAAAIAGLALALLAGAELVRAQAPSQPARPQRIVSLNLCTDQLVLALADRDQIAGLTRNANDAAMSAEARRASGLRRLTGSAEEILVVRPDLVVGMPARGSPALAALRNESYRTLDIGSTETLAQIRMAIREVAGATGHAARGHALVARMDRELAAIPRPGAGKVAVYYQRRGFVSGGGTLSDELIRRSGMTNLAVALGKPALAQVSIEEIVAARPDYIIVDSSSDRVVDQGTEMLHHPALGGIPQIVIPEAWTLCGGPAYVLAARSIAAQVAAHRHR